jgi:hypothetical protein
MLTIVLLMRPVQTELVAMLADKFLTLKSIDLAAIFKSYRQHVAIKDTEKASKEQTWISHLEEHRNMLCPISTLLLAVCYATGGLLLTVALRTRMMAFMLMSTRQGFVVCSSCI